MELELPDPLEGKPKAVRESLAIPPEVRAIVDERDQFFCRVCGQFLGAERRAHHHIVYGGDSVGMGGRRVHDPDHIITVGWLPGEDCHSLVHSSKRLWQPILLAVVNRKGVTAFQYKRWMASNERKARRGRP